MRERWTHLEVGVGQLLDCRQPERLELRWRNGDVLLDDLLDVAAVDGELDRHPLATLAGATIELAQRVGDQLRCVRDRAKSAESRVRAAHLEEVGRDADLPLGADDACREVTDDAARSVSIRSQTRALRDDRDDAERNDAVAAQQRRRDHALEGIVRERQHGIMEEP